MNAIYWLPVALFVAIGLTCYEPAGIGLHDPRAWLLAIGLAAALSLLASERQREKP